MRTLRLTSMLGAFAMAGTTLLVAAPHAAAGLSFTTRFESVSRTPALQLYKKSVRVSGVFEAFDTSDSTWKTVDGSDVNLQRRLAGTTTWRTLDTKPSASGGTVAFKTRVVANAAYRLDYPGGTLASDPTTVFSASDSQGLAVKVARNLGAREHHLTGRKYGFFGKVSPAYKHQTVVLQQKGAHGWHAISHQMTTKKSGWAFVVTAKPTKGTLKFRTYTLRSKQFLTSYSREFHLTTY